MQKRCPRSSNYIVFFLSYQIRWLGLLIKTNVLDQICGIYKHTACIPIHRFTNYRITRFQHTICTLSQRKAIIGHRQGLRIPSLFLKLKLTSKLQIWSMTKNGTVEERQEKNQVKQKTGIRLVKVLTGHRCYRSYFNFILLISWFMHLHIRFYICRL